MTAAVASGEQMVFPAECHRTDGAFDRIGVEFDAAVVEEAGQAGPPSERIADGVGQRAARWDERELRLQPAFHRLAMRPGERPPHCHALRRSLDAPLDRTTGGAGK